MPYKKKDRVPFQSFTELIRGKGFNSIKLAEALDCSPNTAMSKLRKPSRFTLQDIARLSKRGHIHIEELREAIKE